MVRFILGELEDVLMASSRAIPEKLQQAGFSFRFPDVTSALLDLVNH
jgi:NAD dependent epimerase/dehydratase family enzyme